MFVFVLQEPKRVVLKEFVRVVRGNEVDDSGKGRRTRRGNKKNKEGFRER